jgi:hypothetical protein
LHAVCFQSQCEVRPGADWTEDERAEDAAGRGTDAHGECYAASDCAPQPLTSFPQGLTDAQGHDLCPVCPRPGQPLADEEAHIAERAPRCPQRACAPTALECRQYTCALSPTRPPREQARALPPQTLEQPEPPYTPPLPSGADYACTSTADCTLGHINACRCDRPTEPMNKKAAAERDALPPSSCPCIVQQDPPPIPPPVCFQRLCVSPDLAQEHKDATAAMKQYQIEQKAWQREQAKRRRALADLRPWDEVEVEVEVEGDDEDSEGPSISDRSGG